MDRMHPVNVGSRTEAKILAALLDRYDTVLLPYGENCRYDLVIDTPDGMKRIQCKTGRYRQGTVRFRTSSSTMHHKNGHVRSYYGEADFFGVYCPDLKTSYLVPVDICGPNQAHLRVDIAKNNQNKGIRLASDFLLD